jgi:hypothetical protein
MRTITRGASANAGLIFHVFAQDSTSTSGAGKASVAYSSWSCRYIRNGEAISGAITAEDITTIGTYAAPTANTNIRIKAVDNTNMIGVYEVQIHADWVNTTNSCQSLTIYLTASGVAVLPIQIPLVAFDKQTSMDSLVDLVWDEVLTGATHNVASSSGRRLRTASGGQLDSGTAQAGGADSITLATSASTTAGLYVGCQIAIDGGKGAGQSRYIVGYTAGRVAYVARHWTTDPDATSTYVLFADNQVPFIHMGLAQAGAAGTITLQSTASATDDIYNGQLIRVLSGTGDDQIRLITDYNGTTKVATIEPNWATNPDNTSYYGTLQHGIAWAAQIDTNAQADIRTALGMGSANLDTQLDALPTAGETADAVWDEARAGHVGAGSFGEGVASVQGNVTGSVASVTGAVGSVTGSVGSVTGAVGSVTGAVGSVTGNVGGNVTGSIGSVAAGGITAASIATNAIDADALAADAVTEIWAGSTAPTAAAIATAVWTEALPGAFGAGAAGKIVGDNVNATISSRSTLDAAGVRTAVGLAAANLDTQLSTIDTVVDAILLDTGTDGVVLSAAQMNKIADHTIRRTQANARASADGDAVNHRSLLGQLSKVNNLLDAASSPGNILVYAEDDATLFVTIPITTDAAAEPITIINPPA